MFLDSSTRLSIRGVVLDAERDGVESASYRLTPRRRGRRGVAGGGNKRKDLGRSD